MAFVQSSLRAGKVVFPFQYYHDIHSHHYANVSSGSSLRTSFASSSSVPLSFRPLASFHTSASISAESAKARAARLTRKKNIEGKEQRARKLRETRPHVVLGTRPGDNAKWLNCDLAKVILTPEDIRNAAESSGRSPIDPPEYLGYGADGAGLPDVREDNETFLFDDLKAASMKYELSDRVQDEIIRSGSSTSSAENVCLEKLCPRGLSLTHNSRVRFSTASESRRTSRWLTLLESWTYETPTHAGLLLRTGNVSSPRSRLLAKTMILVVQKFRVSPPNTIFPPPCCHLPLINDQPTAILLQLLSLR